MARTTFEIVGEPIALERHAGERRRGGTVLACGGCCCCCCCCLHTVGSLAGAVGATAWAVSAKASAPKGGPMVLSPRSTVLRCRKCGSVGRFEWAGEVGEAPKLVCKGCGATGPAPAKPAAAASPARALASTEAEVQSRRTAAFVYWLVLGGMTLLTLAIAGAGNRNDATMGLILLALAYPAVQVVASIVSLVILAVMPGAVVPSKGAALGAVGRITALTVGGAAIGVAAMFGFGALLSAVSAVRS